MRRVTITITPELSEDCNESIAIDNSEMSHVEILDYLNTLMETYSYLLIEDYKETMGVDKVKAKDLNSFLNHLRDIDKIKRDAQTGQSQGSDGEL